jgi:transcription initiation factor TFIIIB Brf1 subunit/transcription initiation factor TFIIB
MTEYLEMKCINCGEKRVTEDTERHIYVCTMCGFEEDTLY